MVRSRVDRYRALLSLIAGTPATRAGAKRNFAECLVSGQNDPAAFQRAERELREAVNSEIPDIEWSILSYAAAASSFL